METKMGESGLMQHIVEIVGMAIKSPIRPRQLESLSGITLPTPFFSTAEKNLSHIIDTYSPFPDQRILSMCLTIIYLIQVLFPYLATQILKGLLTPSRSLIWGGFIPPPPPMTNYCSSVGVYHY